ncbi:MAG: hypothetical protein V9E90_03195 [Saprospiraceae bacterium]|jgi:hypothetical protein
METKNKTTDQEIKTSDQKFDAVKFMREQRDKISKSLSELSPEQILRHFEEVKNSSDIRPSA